MSAEDLCPNETVAYSLCKYRFTIEKQKSPVKTGLFLFKIRCFA
jgi:hypothetical protein